MSALDWNATEAIQRNWLAFYAARETLLGPSVDGSRSPFKHEDADVLKHLKHRGRDTSFLAAHIHTREAALAQRPFGREAITQIIRASGTEPPVLDLFHC